MIGMNRETGAMIEGEEHLVQSIGDILSTPLGTRVMRRDYGSLLMGLIDAPLNSGTRMLCVMAIALALARWEPRIAVDQILLTGDFPAGEASLIIIGHRTDLPTPNEALRLAIPLSLPR